MKNINQMTPEERAAWLALPTEERIRQIHADLDAKIEIGCEARVRSYSPGERR